MPEVFERIKKQCDQWNIPVRGMEGFPLILYGVTWPELRLGNIIAIAKVALAKGQYL